MDPRSSAGTEVYPRALQGAATPAPAPDWWLELLPDDPDAFELRAPDVEHPDDVDPDRAARWADTSWGRDLHDPNLWAEPAV